MSSLDLAFDSGMGNVFPLLSLDRSKIHWEEYIYKMTWVEQRGRLRIKRDDLFAPLGLGGVNGAKVRQIIYLVMKYLGDKPARPGLLLAGSVKSPQLGRVAAVARHFGIPCLLVIGSDPDKAIRNGSENVLTAANFGASFVRAPAPYNPVLQKVARELHAKPEYKDYYLMEYGLSVEGSEQRIEEFYRFASTQTHNMPEDIETILMPSGSMNATLALLYGIARNRPRSLRRVILFGIGPTRLDWFEERMSIFDRHAGGPCSELFWRDYVHHPELSQKYNSATHARAGMYKLVHYDLHSTKFASYQDEMPAKIGNIELHPTYEGKMMTYVAQTPTLAPYLTDGKTLFWIVGGPPRWSAMEEHVRAYLQESVL